MQLEKLALSPTQGVFLHSAKDVDCAVVYKGNSILCEMEIIDEVRVFLTAKGLLRGSVVRVIFTGPKTRESIEITARVDKLVNPIQGDFRQDCTVISSSEYFALEVNS